MKMKNPFESFVAKFTNGDANQGETNPAFAGDEGDEGKDKTKNYQTVTLERDQQEDVTKQGASSDGTGRDQWSNPVEFLLSCIAMSVGLGNVWRFPFVAYQNGGGAFLIPYIIILVFVGKPLYYMELCMGQFASAGSVRVWDIVPAMRGIGYGQAVATWCVVTYYVSLMALTVFYFIVSFSSELPWSSCHDKLQCYDSTTNITGIDLSQVKPAAEFYFEEDVLQIHRRGLDDGIFAPEWRLALCLLFAWVVLFLVLVKGVKSAGKSAYFTAIFPYLVLFILLIRGATLPGAAKGVLFFITPKWHKLLEPQVWFAAVGQSFFSLSVGFGSIIMFSSYNDFRHNVYRDAGIISVVDTLTSLLAGFTIFAILGHLAEQLGTNVEDIVKGGGSGLAFISYPDVLARFDWVPQLFAVLFFLMLVTLGVGSASALAGCIITIICDEFPKIKRIFITLGVCISGFLLGLFYVTPQGQFILDLVDHYGGNFVIFILAFLEVAAVHWLYGLKNFLWDIEFMLGRKTGIYWRICWGLFIPLLLIVIFIYTLASQPPLKSGQYVYGSGAHAFGIILSLIALLLIPIFIGYTFYKSYKTREDYHTIWKSFTHCFKSSSKWSPLDPQVKEEYLKFIHDKKEANLIVAEEYLGVAGTIHKSPGFHFKRILLEIKFYLLEVFWED